MTTVVVLDDWERAFERCADWRRIRAAAQLTIHCTPLTGSALHAEVARADVLVLNRDRTPLDAALVASAARLKYVVFTGPRNRRIDFGALARRAIPVSCTQGGPAIDSTCEHTWALILGLARQLYPWASEVAGGGWRPDSPLALPIVLRGQRLGLIGCGNIGAQVAAVGLAFGMDVVTWSPNMTPERAARHGAVAVSLPVLLATSRIISLHLVAAPGLHGLLDAGSFGAMRRDALLINTSRAELVDTDALLHALDNGLLAGAALDVFPHEPLAPGHPLRTKRNALLTPHVGFLNAETISAFAQGAVEAVTAWLEERPLPNRVEAPAAT